MMFNRLYHFGVRVQMIKMQTFVFPQTSDTVQEQSTRELVHCELCKHSIQIKLNKLSFEFFWMNCLSYY